MQLARAAGTVIEVHHAFEKASAALLTALAAQLSRLEYAESSVIRAVCSEAASSRMMEKKGKRKTRVILKCLDVPRRGTRFLVLKKVAMYERCLQK
jgi:hypothetical protein